ncbi:hypothetical protein J1N35_034640 [Gossypium stocksii]|uniref:Uncharacterized protein n=1 Tax=Gossypium stocksii TaxID=47602 RepID=A0A9D3ZQW7_9ROSI|nr:hypothetical protein J1N35_034640 [Gossypium stocksii]
MHCVSSISTRVVWNGKVTDSFILSRGLREGHKVSVQKTKIYFLKNVKDDLKQQLSDNLGFARVNDLGKYLSVPLLHQMVSKGTYQYLIQKLQQKLLKWKTKTLSLAGHITLVKLILLALPMYAMQSM